MFKKRENKNIIDTMSAEEARKIIPQKDWSTQVNSSAKSKTMEEDGLLKLATMHDSAVGRTPVWAKDASGKTGVKLDSQGKPVIKDESLMRSRAEYDWKNKFGQEFRGSGFEDQFISNDTGEMNIGPYHLTKKNGKWIDDSGSEWSEEMLKNSLLKKQEIAENVYNSTSLQQAWENFNPLAHGDTQEYKQKMEEGQITFNPETGAYDHYEVYAKSSDDYLQRRKDINDPRNVKEEPKQGLLGFSWPWSK